MGEDGSVINKDNSPVLTWAAGKFRVNNHAHIMSEMPEKAILRFLFYYLSTVDVSAMVRGTPPKINQQQLRSIRIPLPPLPVKREIVKILDNFTELTVRKTQYEYNNFSDRIHNRIAAY
jgi:type I restriction enzyme S subunit